VLASSTRLAITLSGPREPRSKLTARDTRRRCKRLPGVSQDQAARLLRTALYEVPDTAAKACALLASLGSHGIPTLVDGGARSVDPSRMNNAG